MHKELVGAAGRSFTVWCLEHRSESVLKSSLRLSPFHDLGQVFVPKALPLELQHQPRV